MEHTSHSTSAVSLPAVFKPWPFGHVAHSVQDVSAQLDVALKAAPSGGGSFVNLGVRRVGSSDYRAKVWFSSRGVVQLSVVRVVSGAETALRTVTLPGTYTAGDVLRVRVEAVGSGTSLRAEYEVRMRLPLLLAAPPAALGQTVLSRGGALPTPQPHSR